VHLDKLTRLDLDVGCGTTRADEHTSKSALTGGKELPGLGPPTNAGARGPEGRAGPKGEPGSMIASWKIDRARYAALPILEDGAPIGTARIVSAVYRRRAIMLTSVTAMIAAGQSLSDSVDLTNAPPR
jgi:hypothetical protein